MFFNRIQLLPTSMSSDLRSNSAILHLFSAAHLEVTLSSRALLSPFHPTCSNSPFHLSPIVGATQSPANKRLSVSLSLIVGATQGPANRRLSVNGSPSTLFHSRLFYLVPRKQLFSSPDNNSASSVVDMVSRRHPPLLRFLSSSDLSQ